jgi:hypothetical protein
MSANNPLYSDVHRDAEMTCTDCHSSVEMHGDGTEYASMREPGAIKTTCDNPDCHPAESLAGYAAHDLHMEDIFCTACHVQTVSTCYSCHFETEVYGHMKRHYAPPKGGFVFLLNRPDGKVTTASYQSLAWGDTAFYAMGVFNGHTISRDARDCSDCHNNANVQEYNDNGKIKVSTWDEGTKALTHAQGVIPVPPDWLDALELDIITYTGDVTDPVSPVDSSKWTFLKTGVDSAHMLYAEPLTEDQMAYLSMPMDIPETFATSLHATRRGKANWYAKENGGFENFTNVPMDSLPCLDCHAANYADGTPVDPETYEPGCRDCHDFANKGTEVAQATCLPCHSRQGVEINMSTSNPMFSDVHRDAGMECVDCHTLREMHGDGIEYASMRAEGAMDAACTNCHPTSQLADNSEHNVHAEDIYCTACHVQTVQTCYSCHFETEVYGHKKRHYAPPKSGFVFLLNRPDGMITTASYQSVSWGDTAFYAMGAFNGHTITAAGRTCSDCHNNANVQEYNNTGKIKVTTWNETTKELAHAQGVIPVPEDFKDALEMDIITYTGDVSDPVAPVDSSMWTLLKTGVDSAQILFATPLTASQIAKMSIPVSSVAVNDGALPETFALEQNYPNPFNPSTRINFALPANGEVELNIYNLLGEQVRTLINGNFSAGYHSIEWDGRNDNGVPLSGGMYIYRLETDNQVQSRKMILLK